MGLKLYVEILNKLVKYCVLRFSYFFLLLSVAETYNLKLSSTCDMKCFENVGVTKRLFFLKIFVRFLKNTVLKWQ